MPRRKLDVSSLDPISYFKLQMRELRSMAGKAERAGSWQAVATFKRQEKACYEALMAAQEQLRLREEERVLETTDLMAEIQAALIHQPPALLEELGSTIDAILSGQIQVLG